eukprot:1139438-Pelagomonas_calceolata.AAC.1
MPSVLHSLSQYVFGRELALKRLRFRFMSRLNITVETPPALARCPLIDHAQMAAYLEKYNPQKIATDLGAATA